MSIPALLDITLRKRTRLIRLQLFPPKAKMADHTAGVRILHLTETGFLLESDTALLAGEDILVEFFPRRSASAKVTWVSRRLFGCQFQKHLSPSILEAIYEHLQENSQTQSGGEMESLVQTSFGKRLKRLRMSRGLSQQEVADKLGISKPSVCHWESDKSRPHETRIADLSEILGVSILYLKKEDTKILQSSEDILRHNKEVIARLLGISPEKIKILLEI